MRMKAGFNKAMGVMMNFFMLSCEDATLLMTKKQLGKISFLKRVQLKMHLLSCKLCRRFKVQNEHIQKFWTDFEESNRKLSSNKKEELESMIQQGQG